MKKQYQVDYSYDVGKDDSVTASKTFTNKKKAIIHALEISDNLRIHKSEKSVGRVEVWYADTDGNMITVWSKEVY